MSRGLVVRHIGRLTSWTQPVLTDAAVVVRDGVVVWLGADRDLPRDIGDMESFDARGAAVLPGFVDCHTHAVWAGDRRSDLLARLGGEDYDPVGISATVAATRAATFTELLDATVHRLAVMRRHGTTTVEVKSGYGLTPHDEVRLLAVAELAAESLEADVTTTFLGAHVLPDGRARDDYVAEVIATVPEAAGRGAEWCDVFCDDGAFTVAEARRVLTAAREAGLGLRIHAEQLARTGAALLAAELGCASADHLDHVSATDAAALAAAGVVGVLVPVASLYTGSHRWGHAATLRDAGCTLALATDCNPGTAWCESMPYAIQLGCLEMGLSLDQALRAATSGGAAALRRTDIGRIGVGTRGDLVVLDSDHEVDLVAHLGVNPVRATVVAGALALTSA